MIIDTGNRTDIPAFYSEWFMNRIREGYVMVRNPYSPEQVSRYRLDPEVVDALMFCSKNPEPMVKYLDELDKFKMIWFVTITPYGKGIEPGVPDKRKVIESFKKITDMEKKLSNNKLKPSSLIATMLVWMMYKKKYIPEIFLEETKI